MVSIFPPDFGLLKKAFQGPVQKYSNAISISNK